MTGQGLYTRILVPTDGSEAADAAIDHAVTIARATEATIHALYVIDSRITMAAQDDTRADLESSLADEGSTAVERIADRAAVDGVSAVTELGRGTPSKEILDYTDRVGIDLIVMGSAGKSAREKLIRMGSVSERVVDKAQVPVLVVPQGDRHGSSGSE